MELSSATFEQMSLNPHPPLIILRTLLHEPETCSGVKVFEH